MPKYILSLYLSEVKNRWKRDVPPPKKRAGPIFLEDEDPGIGNAVHDGVVHAELSHLQEVVILRLRQPVEVPEGRGLVTPKSYSQK